MARFKYLKNKAEKKGYEIKVRDMIMKDKDESKKRKVENLIVSKRFRTILKGLENNFTKLKTVEEHE
jgi:hypothetical protein